uniref:Ig-like domain-containing protein n=1 Tax=Eptatretus burgeri TaxID=7764 RepID=A0A8C4WY80_EPTBU
MPWCYCTGEYNLQIKQTELGDEAWYQCQVSPSQTSQGIVSQSIWLNVLVPPQSLVIVEYPGVDEVTWVAGKEYQLTCTAMDAKPTPKVTWYKNDMELPTEDVTDLEGSQPKLSSRVVVTKYIATATDNKAKVRCEAQNPALTQARQVEFTLIVFFPPAFPVIDGQTDMLTVKAGDIARFPCSSKGGNPLASVKWFKGNEVIFGTWETEEKGSVPFSRSVLEFSVSPTDNGVTLRCEAGNHVTPEPMKVSITLRVICKYLILLDPQNASKFQAAGYPDIMEG